MKNKKEANARECKVSLVNLSFLKKGLVTTILVISVFAIFTAVASAPPCTCGDICVNETGWWRADATFNASNTPIQHAINNATAGDSIYVYNGSYTENIDVGTAHLTLQGEGRDGVTVTAVLNDDHVFEVTKDYVNISGFNVSGATGTERGGIYVFQKNNFNVSNNIVSNCYYGIYSFSSDNDIVCSNTVYNCSNQGIYLAESNDCTITDCVVHNCSNSGSNGFYVQVSNDCQMTNLEAYYNFDGIDVRQGKNNTVSNCSSYNNVNYGFVSLKATNNTYYNNSAYSNDKAGFYVHTSTEGIFDENSAYNNTRDGFDIYNNSVNNDFKNNMVYDNGYNGVYLHSGSDNNDLTNNTVSVNDNCGIYLCSASNNTLSNNTVNSNHNYGIRLWSASNNTLSNNAANSNDYDGIWLCSASNSTLSNNTANSNCCGITLRQSSNYNTITGNTANSNGNYGINLRSSSSNNITCNWVAHNNDRGFHLCDGSTGNNISYNNIMSNGVLVDDSWHYNFYNEQDDPVDATNNWWGTNNNTIINASIYDGHDDHTKGNVTFLPKLSEPDPCSPIPELATIVLLSVGLLALAGYIRIRRRD